MLLVDGYGLNIKAASKAANCRQWVVASQRKQAKTTECWVGKGGALAKIFQKNRSGESAKPAPRVVAKQ